MGKMILISGGARSGKSNFALSLAGRDRKVIFIATCRNKSEAEMAERIRRHRLERPKHWKTLEEEADLPGVIKTASCDFPDAIIVDCLTLWVSNLLAAKTPVAKILALARETAIFAAGISTSIILVTNEVGAGIVPVNNLARMFRDIAGSVNQIFATYSHEVYLLVCGVPLKIKQLKRRTKVRLCP